MRATIRILATGLGLGLIPWAPGTFGTLLGVAIAMVLYRGGPVVFMATTLAFILFAIIIAHKEEQLSQSHDSSEIVIDEVAGYLVAMMWLPSTWQAYLYSFILFRVLDVWKPYPIRRIDREIPGGFGVVMDDVAAGLIANVILQVLFVKTKWLGIQLRIP